MTSADPLDRRLYGLAEQIHLRSIHGYQETAAPARGVIEEQDAVDAAGLLFVAIDQQVRAGCLSMTAASRMVALLMVIRDRIRPLPPGIATDGSDLLTSDLAQMAHVIRIVRSTWPTGLPATDILSTPGD